MQHKMLTFMNVMKLAEAQKWYDKETFDTCGANASVKLLGESFYFEIFFKLRFNDPWAEFHTVTNKGGNMTETQPRAQTKRLGLEL